MQYQVINNLLLQPTKFASQISEAWNIFKMI
jgi:hypothetical protein